MLYIKPKQKMTKEYLFLMDFLKYNYIANYHNDEDLDYTLIQEPYTGFGYTDLVYIVWSKNIYKRWNTERNKLLITDIKILHHLFNCKKFKCISDINKELGFSIRTIMNSISKLYDAGLLVKNKSGKYKTLAKNEIFFVKEIISIEAKLKDWKRALYQAMNNYYYSSESYALFPQKIITDNLVRTYKQSNIGVIAFDENINIIKKSERNEIPSTISSWLFNEHIGRTLCI
jgi:predicted transcriptional regulator